MNKENLRYAETHEWISIEGEIGTIGISDYALKELTDIVYLELPEAGTDISKDQSFGVIESVKAVFDLNSPVSGSVVESNKDLEGDLQSLSSDSWFIKVKLSNTEELDSLMDADAYKKKCEE